MSKIIASAAIRGAHKIVDQADKKWQQAMDKWGANWIIYCAGELF